METGNVVLVGQSVKTNENKKNEENVEKHDGNEENDCCDVQQTLSNEQYQYRFQEYIKNPARAVVTNDAPTITASWRTAIFEAKKKTP